MTRRYLLDTGPAQDFLFQRQGIQDRVAAARRGGAKIGICTPVLGEIIGGLEGSDSRGAAWEIARVLAAMGRMQPLEIPNDVAADLDAWERMLELGVTE